MDLKNHTVSAERVQTCKRWWKTGETLAKWENKWQEISLRKSCQVILRMYFC